MGAESQQHAARQLNLTRSARYLQQNQTYHLVFLGQLTHLIQQVAGTLAVPALGPGSRQEDRGRRIMGVIGASLFENFRQLHPSASFRKDHEHAQQRFGTGRVQCQCFATLPLSTFLVVTCPEPTGECKMRAA